MKTTKTKPTKKPVLKSKTKPKTKSLPPRDKVKAEDTWDLQSLYPSDAAWEKGFKAWEGMISHYTTFAGTLGHSPMKLRACLDFDQEFERLGERLGTYAYLRTTEDVAKDTYQEMIGRYRHAASNAGQASAYIKPEIMAIPDDAMNHFLSANELADYRLMLERMLRYKPHTLGPNEEKLLAMQAQMSETSNQVFRQLNDSDLKFGTCKNEKGETVELSTATFSSFMHSSKRVVRETAFQQYYEEYAAHANTLAATLDGSIQRDVYYAKARGYKSARENSLFHDNMPLSVYDNLIAAVRKNLPALHKYYEVRRRKMKLTKIHHYDTYVPVLSDLQTRNTWAQATKTIIAALQPLGTEYCDVLEKGLTGRWCDRYPNRGKQSGAFSYGVYDGDPYILMNYQPDVLDHVYTLAHEAGHSMHSHYSAKTEPHLYYNYTIFVAEVASTFNEQLLGHHLLKNAKSDKERAYLINREIDSIRATIFRQTMFAEFEKITHELCEAGEPLTLARFRQVYSELLKAYFGPKFAIDDCLSLECFRIPHFYRAFYVYKYATGLSAAIALSQRVLKGGEQELDDYLNFLRGGCSKDPLDLLRGAGVDMEKPEPVDTALEYFAKLVNELDELL